MYAQFMKAKAFVSPPPVPFYGFSLENWKMQNSFEPRFVCTCEDCKMALFFQP
jgi:hypothetical protein